MDLQTWSFIADITAAAGVIASLCFLAFEIRLYLRQVRQESLDVVVSRRHDLVRILATDAELASIVWRAFAATPRIAPHEWARFGLYMYAVLLEYERMWVKVNTGALDAGVLETWEKGFGWWFRQPGVQAWWRSDHPGFTPAFAAYVDKVATRSPEDGSIARVVAASFRGEWREPATATPPAPPGGPPPPPPTPGSP